jgi:ABC-type amino acid transport substrate-binding protein
MPIKEKLLIPRHNKNPREYPSMKISRFSCTIAQRFAFLLMTILLASSLEAKTHIKIAVGDSRIEGAFNHWTASTPWDKIEHYQGPDAIRPVVDLVLQLQALKAGGLDFDYELVVYPGFERAKLETVQGKADLSAETVWDRDITEHADKLLKTDPIIRNGEFEKGLYVLSTNAAALKVASVDDLKNFSCAVPAAWSLDVELLEQLHTKNMEKPGRIENVFLMLEKGRVDFALMEFSATPDLTVENNGVRLVPIPNCKVALNDSRSWIVSKASAESAAIFAALDKGTKALRAEGRLERAFKECGFLNQNTANWKRLK